MKYFWIHNFILSLLRNVKKPNLIAIKNDKEIHFFEKFDLILFTYFNVEFIFLER